jgi:hypothetical protein
MSNGIGQFQIGISSIGKFPFDWTQTVYAQYANSPVLLALIEYFSEEVDPAEDIDNFFDDVWNVDTAKGWGLDVWGRIVGVNRVLQIPTSKFFGFDEATTVSADPFNQSPFYSGTSNTQNYALSDEAFRRLILAKAAANIWDGSIPGLNNILRLVSPNPLLACYVVDHGDMTMTYTFGFTPTAVDLAILINSGVLPHPAGVTVLYSY